MNHLVANAAPTTNKTVAPRRILAVFNPAAGRNRRARFDAVIAAVRALGCPVTVVETNAPGHAEEIARAVAVEDFDVIAAAGGDGTINEIVNGLPGKAIALGIIPLGTANVLADEIGLGKATNIVARALAEGPPRPIYVGRANGRRFCMMAGAGFDANVVDGISLALKKRVGPLAYAWQAFVQGFRDTYSPCEVTIDGVVHRTTSAVACNGRRYGGPFVAAPRASLTDDSFQVVLMKGRGWFSVLRYGLGLMVGKVGAWPDVDILTGREVTITGGKAQPVQADGDILTTLPLKLEIDPEPVRLIYPAPL
jgi:diacylglycerol kinase (ATP)